jgi:hypothetical protein
MDDETLAFDFQYLFRRWSTWYRLRRACAWLLKGLIFGLSLALGFSLVTASQASLLKNEYGPLITQFSLFSMAVAGLAGLVWPISKEQLARFFDQHFGLQERSSTSLELLKNFKKVSEPILSEQNQADDLIEKQLQDTLVAGSRVHPHARFFFNMTHLQGILIGSLIAGLALLGTVGEPLFQRAMQQRQTRQAIVQESARLEALAEEIRRNEQLSPEQREQITQSLEEAVKKLNESQTTEQALAVLTSTENRLRSLEDSQAKEQAESLQNAGKRLLDENPVGSDTPLQSFAQNLSEGNPLAAAQDLSELDLGQLSPEEASSLADQLEEASQTLAETNPELSQALDEAAQALKNGNPQAAQQALKTAAQALANTGQQIAQAQTAGQAAEQINQGQERLIQAGSGQAQTSQPGANGQTGQGQGSQGQGTGDQSGNSSGNGGGSGAGEGESTGQEGDGPEAGADPIQQNNQVGDGGIRTYEEIYAPQRLGGSSGDEVALPENRADGDQIIGEGAVEPGSSNPSRVPYIDVLPGYTEAYRKAVEAGQVPVSLQALVKKYFSSLEP